MTGSKDIVSFLQKELKAQADAKKAVEMAAYMKTEMPFYGVQKPERVQIYKMLKKQFPPGSAREYAKNVRRMWALPHREEKYAALEYACMFPQFITVDSIELYSSLIREGAWWDFVDVVAINLVGQVLLLDRSNLKETIDSWSDDDDMWIRRTSLICHNHHKAKTDRKQLFDTCLKLSGEKEFFIRKAIGWALREYSYANPDAVRSFVTRHKGKLSPLSFREATKQLVRSGFMEELS